jgi:hypothetical protein
MYRESPPYIVAGEIVKTSRMFARSVSPLNRQWLWEISPSLAEEFMAGEKKRGKKKSEEKKKKRDTTWEIKLGGEIFKLEPYKKNKKIAILPWEKISKVVRATPPDELKRYESLRGKIVYDGWEIHSGDQLGSILKIIPYLDPPRDVREKPRKRGSFSTYSDLPQLCEELEKLLKLTKSGKKGKVLGFFALDTDGTGNYWLKVIRSFHTAVDVSLASLEALADELSEEVDRQHREQVNDVYRKLSRIYENY